MKKSILTLIFGALIFLLLPIQSHAATSLTKIILDGREISLSNDIEVLNVQNSIMVPIRVVAENLNFNVTWDPKTQNVNIQQESKTISLTVGKHEAFIDNSPLTLNIAPQLTNNTVFVPLRFISEGMGLDVSWNNQEKIVTLTSPSPLPDLSSGETEDEGNTTTNNIHEISYVNNQLVVSLDHEATPMISTLKNPDRIVLDFPSTQYDNTAQPLPDGAMGKLDVADSPNITEIRYSLFKNDPAQVRIVIELNHVSSVSYSQQSLGGNFILDLSLVDDPTLASPVTEGKKIVVIDPGHGGSDPGTTSITKKYEKYYNLALALKVQAALQKEPGIEVIMTRETDVYPTRSERVKLANDLNADIFISIHGNSATASPQASGTETFYYQRASSKELATIVHKHLVGAMGLKDRGVSNASFQVIRETTMPAILLETGFLSNKTDEEAMSSESIQNKAAQAIVDGIKEYLKL